jgi:hypothetical protein
MKKNQVFFSGTDEDFNLLILFQLQNSPGAKTGVCKFISIMIKVVIPLLCSMHSLQAEAAHENAQRHRQLS